MFGLSKTKTLTGLQKSLFGAYFREKQLQPCGAGSNDKCRGAGRSSFWPTEDRD
jgi:hypothetical protein